MKNKPKVIFGQPYCPTHNVEMDHLGWGVNGPRLKCPICGIVYEGL